MDPRLLSAVGPLVDARSDEFRLSSLERRKAETLCEELRVADLLHRALSEAGAG